VLIIIIYSFVKKATINDDDSIAVFNFRKRKGKRE